MNDVKFLVENPNPIYTRYFWYWQFMMDSYEGGVDYCQGKLDQTSSDTGIVVKVNGKTISSMFSGNMFKHKKEREEDYRKRIEMSYYYNFCAPVIDIYTNHLFKEPVITDMKGINETTITATENNVDRMGSSMVEFRKQMAEQAQVFGHCFVLCDKPAIPEGRQVVTLRDQMDVGLFPYYTLLRPSNIINWSLDAFGLPYWVLIKDEAEANIDPFNFDANVKNQCKYRLWTRKEWVVYDNEYKEIARGLHTAGEVPITCVFDKKSKKAKNFLGISQLADIAFISRDIYNSCSELREILRNQTFAFLAVQGSADEYKDLTIGTSKGLLYPEGRNAPEYVSPPPANAEVMFSHIDRQVHKIFQLAKLEGGSSSGQEQQTADPKSGTSKAWDFNETNSTLAMKAGNLEDAETRMWKQFARQDGGEFEGFVNYPTEFSMKDLKSDLDEAEQLIRISIGQEFNKEIKKAIIQKKFPRLPEDKLSEMIDDMEKTPDANAQGNGGDAKRRFPYLFKNANSSGKNGGNDGKENS